jgi:hypothetical protein
MEMLWYADDMPVDGSKFRMLATYEGSGDHWTLVSAERCIDSQHLGEWKCSDDARLKAYWHSVMLQFE